MLTYINLPQTDRSEDIPKATCNSPQRLLTVQPTASGLTARAARSRLTSPLASLRFCKRLKSPKTARAVNVFPRETLGLLTGIAFTMRLENTEPRSRNAAAVNS